MKKLAMALVPFLVLACGGDELTDANGDGIADGVQDPNNVTVVVPATPKGTISGQVLSTQQKPLTGVNVALTIGATLTTKTATTDESGSFAFQEVPGGAQVLLTFSKEGYAPLRAYSSIPTEAGNVPINNGNASFGPVLLSETSGTVKFILISPTGRPAAGVKATLEVDGAGTVLFGPTDSVSSTVVAEATADAQGVVTFTNVPPPAEIDRITTGSVYKLVVYAYDENGDGVLESNGLVSSYSGLDLLRGFNAKPLSLPYAYAPGAGLAIDYSNLAALKNNGPVQPQYNMLKTGDSIYVVFNQPVQANSVILGLTDEYGKENLTVNKASANGGLSLTISPTGLQAGKEYNLYVRATSIQDGTSISKSVAFFAGDPAAAQPISIDATARFYDSGVGGVGKNNNQLDSGEVVFLSFNQVMKRYGGTLVQTFFDTDINNATTAVVGEWNPSDKNNTGFGADMFEPPNATYDPTPVFTNITPSGYTTRLAFTYGGGSGTYKALNAGIPYPMVIAFGKILAPSSDGYQSAWGVPQTSNINVSVTFSAIPTP